MSGPRHSSGLLNEAAEMITINHPQRHRAPQFDRMRPHLHYFPIAAPRTSINVDLVARLQRIRSKNCDGVRALVHMGVMRFVFRVPHLAGHRSSHSFICPRHLANRSNRSPAKNYGHVPAACCNLRSLGAVARLFGHRPGPRQRSEHLLG
jgi:hypothetical protein